MRAFGRFPYSGLLLFLSSLPALAGDVYRITGVAISEQTGAPVPQCHITAMRSGQTPTGPGQRLQGRAEAGSRSPSAETDAQGHFALDVPGAGSWQVYAFGRGFRLQAFDRHENFFSSVVLTPAKPTYNLRLLLEPDSVVSGTVLDEAGEAVRNARVTLLVAPPPAADPAESARGVRSSAVTDDRGRYEFADLAPGDYMVEVQAEPWYAIGAPGRRFGGNQTDASTDPVLDVVYPQVYFPGVTERASAEILSLHHGESRVADFHLTPVPATHLRIAPPPSDGPQRGQFFPQVERVSNEGNPFVNTSVQIDRNGQIDVGGLSPGLYRVNLRGPGGQQSPSFFRVSGTSSRSLDLSSAIPVCELTLHFESSSSSIDTTRLQVIFRDVDTGATFTSYGQGGLQRRPAPSGEDKRGAERTLDVPPGRYRVVLNGSSEIYLVGLSAKGETSSGRVLTVGSGGTTVTLTVAEGRALVRGVASQDGNPQVGAMVLLVPAAYGQVGSLQVLRRDQTNTDGSFEIANVIPGEYILLAINSWTVNWHDPATLAGFLVHGIPLTLASGSTAKQDLAAQKP